MRTRARRVPSGLTTRTSTTQAPLFTYESNGNMQAAGGAAYTYSSQNMLASAAVAGGTATYLYDADLQRIKKSFGGSTTYFVRGQGGELLTEWKDPGLASGTIRDFVYAGSRLISAVEKATAQDPNSMCGIIVPGGSAVTVTATSGQNPCFTFSGVAGRKVSARVTAVSPTSLNGTWWVKLRQPDGTQLGSSGSNLTATTSFLDTRTLPIDGTYTLTIDPSGTSSGTVRVTLYDVVHVTGSIVPDGNPVTAVLGTPGQNAYLTFTGTQGQTVSATMTAISPSGFSNSWDLKILTPDGTALPGSSADGFGCCGDSVALRDAVSLPVSGTYTVFADPDGTLTGTVAVRLYTFSHISGPIVPGGDAVTVSLAKPGQNALLTFSGVQGQRVSLAGWNGTIRLQEVGCDVMGSLLKPEGVALSGSSTCMEGDGFMDVISLPSTGQYTVLVDPKLDALGDLTLRLYDVTTDVTGTLSIGGDPVPVPIGSPGQKATFTFSGTSGQQATVRVTSNAIGSTTVTLKKPDLTTATSKTSSAASFSLTTETLTEGMYTVIVDPGGTRTGTLNLTVTSP